jgi:hypothetical protein
MLLVASVHNYSTWHNRLNFDMLKASLIPYSGLEHIDNISTNDGYVEVCAPDRC